MTRGAFAEYGSDFYADTNTHTGSWCALVVINDAVINELLMNNCTTESAVQAITLVAGTVIYGTITSVDLTSGVVQMIRSASLSNRD